MIKFGIEIFYINLCKMERHTNPSYFIQYEDELPSFLLSFYEWDFYSDEEKFKVTNSFVIKYLSDNNYRKSVQNHYIVIIDKKFFGIKTKEELSDKFFNNLMPFLFEITDTPEDLYLMYSNQVTISDIGNNLVRTNVRISTDNRFTPFISERRLIDSGASYSTIPFIDSWDHSKMKYKDENIGRYDFNPSIFNNSTNSNYIFSQSSIRLKTGGDGTPTSYSLVTFKNPIEISIEDLPPIEISSFVVPRQQISDLNLIGVDILFRHITIISPSRYGLDMKIMPYEGEYKKSIVPTVSNFMRTIGISMLERVDKEKFSDEEIEIILGEINLIGIKFKISVVKI